MLSFGDYLNFPTLASMIIGENATTNWLANNYAHLQLQSDQVDNKLAMVTFSPSSAQGNRIWAYRGKGPQTSPGNVIADDHLLSILAFGRITNSFVQSSAIEFLVDGASDTGVPSRIEFQTSTSSENTPTTRMTIKSDGEVNIPDLDIEAAAYVLVDVDENLYSSTAALSSPSGPKKSFRN